MQLLPECRAAAGFKIFGTDALLFDPGVITEIKYTIATDFVQFFYMFRIHAYKVPGRDLGRRYIIKPFGIRPGQQFFFFAGVKFRAVGRHRHDHILRSEVQFPGGLDCGQHVGDG